MNNQSTDARRRIRVLALAPALVLAVLATNIPCVASTLSAATTTTLVSEDGSKGSNNSANEQIKDEQLNRIVQKVKDTPDGTSEVVNTIKLNANVTLEDNEDLSSLGDHIIYKVDGKQVESIAELTAEEIASININKQGETPIVEVTTKKAQAQAVKKDLQESNIPIEQLQKLQTNVTELNNNGGTNMEISFAGIKDFSVQSAKFVIKDKAEYVCTQVNNSIAEDGAVHVKLHTDEIIGEDVPMFVVHLQTNLGKIAVPIRRGDRDK